MKIHKQVCFNNRFEEVEEKNKQIWSYINKIIQCEGEKEKRNKEK